jgi:hypothetical protein
MWNALDAEADIVEAEIEIAALGDGQEVHPYVTGVTVIDNGHGITPEKANEAFPKLGDSWKRNLNGRTLNNKRPLHGRWGRGRFFAYSLGKNVRWSSVSETDEGFRQIEISGNMGHLDGFRIDDATQATGPTGTTVEIEAEQGRPLLSLLRDDLHSQLIANFAPHLLGNPDITVRVNGIRLEPRPVIEGEPIDITLEVEKADIGDREQPVMTIVDWGEDMKISPGIVLCTPDGASLFEIDRSAPPGTVRSTGYLRWSGWAEAGADLQMAYMDHAPIIDAAKELLAKHVAERTGALKATIVTTLKEERAYPYPDAIADPIQDTERQIFDLVAVTARGPLRSSSPSQRKMTARLLQLALQERPDSLDTILSDALSLSEDERDELAEFLKFSTLGAIVGAGAEVGRRLDLLAALRHVIYSPDVSAKMREVDQLHPLVKDNTWLFGEGWRLSASEAGLTSVLRSVLTEDVALEADLLRKGDHVLLPGGKRGRVDLLMQRTVIGPDDRQDRLVVELKRPSVRLGDDQLTQVRKYARALSEHPAVGPSHWTFWLVGSDVVEGMDSELQQIGREWGHLVATERYDIRIVTWGRLLDQAERSLKFYRDQLNYKVSQEEALERVRRRHQELLPP